MAFMIENFPMPSIHPVAKRCARFGKRVLVFRLILLALLPACGWAEPLPEFRPALMTSGHSLINLIDTKGLVQKGQKDAVTFFSALVGSAGRGGNILVYRGTPGSDLLRLELLRRNPLSYWKPAVFDHKEVGVQVIGTVVFVVRNGEPHLRIFLNQQEEDLKLPTDFVAPQLTYKLHLESPKQGLPRVSPTPAWRAAGVALLNLDVNLKGYVEKALVAYEYPAGKNLGAAAAAQAKYDTFIPGYRNGKAVACRFTHPVLYLSGTKTKFE